MNILKQTIDFYKTQKKVEQEKKKLLNAKTDFYFLETLIKKCNENPNLKIEVHLKDGTHLLLKSYEERKLRDFERIDGNFLEVE